MTEKKKRPSRPSGTENRLRCAALPPPRCTNAEREAVVAAADEIGITISSFVLAASLKAARKLGYGNRLDMPTASRKPRVETTLLAQILAQLGRTQGHLYQIVRGINLDHMPPEWQELKESQAVIKEMRDLLMESMGKRPTAAKKDPPKPAQPDHEKAREKWAEMLRGFDK